MKKSILMVAAVAILASCGDQPTTPAATTLQSFDACSCATVTDKASADFTKCKELRMADAKFESDFQKCLVAKGDTSKIKLVDQTQIPQANAGGYAINVAESSIKWTGTKKIGGKKHTGTIAVKSGNLAYDGTNITGGEIVIDMRSLANTDLTGDSKGKLEGHLKSDDFFAVEKHPEARFVVKSAKSKGGSAFEVTGDLTIKGITKPAVANLNVSKNGDNGATIGGSIVFNRADFDVRYGSDTFFDNLGNDVINNDIILTVSMKGSK